MPSGSFASRLIFTISFADSDWKEGAGPSQPGSEKTAKCERRHSDDYAEHRLKSMREDDTIFPEAPRERFLTQIIS